jgi:hypothetical protein
MTSEPAPVEPDTRLAHRLAAGCVGGLLAAASASWLRFLLDGTLRLDKGTWPFIVAHVVAGGGLVAGGACALRLARVAHVLSWRRLWAWALAAQAVAFASAPLDSTDVFSNLAFGAVRHAGLSAYAVAPSALVGSPITPLVSPRWVDDPSPYGPLFHSIVWAATAIGHALGQPLWGSLLAYKAILLAAVLGTLGLAARHLARARPDVAKETWTYLAIAPMLGWEAQGQGHNDGFLVLAVVACLTAASARRDALATVALAAGVAVKYALAPLLGLYLLLVARRSWTRAVVLAVVAAAVVAASFAPEWDHLTLRSVLPMLGTDASRHARSFTDMVCLLLEWTGRSWRSPAVYGVLAKVSQAACLALLARAAWHARSLETLAHGYALFLVALYLTAPWFQPWYVLWSLPLLLVEPDERWRRLMAAFGVVTMSQWIAALDPFTSVACDAWLAWQVWKLRQPAPAGASAIPATARSS